MTPDAGLDASLRLVVGELDIEVAIAVSPGEVVALVGPNGAGKTSVLHTLAGLRRLGGGHVHLDGATLDDVAAGVHITADQRPVGVAFQDQLLFPHLNALDNVAFGPRRRGVAKAAAREQAHGWLRRFGLSDRAQAWPAELSGGESQRVALARALITEPRLLLLDEPLAGLDVTARLETRRELARQLAASDGATVIVTHDPLEAMALADRLVVMEGGRVVQAGTADQITAQPRSRYVADFVGVNLFRGTARGDRVELAGGGALTVPDTATGEVLAVVHPRAVALHRHRPEGTARNVWSGTVDSVDREGDRVRLQVSGAVPVVAEITVSAATELDLGPGRPVWVSLKATEITVYPA